MLLNVSDDHSRVVLKRDDPKASTYINACYIDVSCDTRFINKAMSRQLQFNVKMHSLVCSSLKQFNY